MRNYVIVFLCVLSAAIVPVCAQVRSELATYGNEDPGTQAIRTCQSKYTGKCPTGFVPERTTTVRCDPTHVWGSIPFDERDPNLRRMCTCVYKKPDPAVPGSKGSFRCEELINMPLSCRVEEGKTSYTQRNLREKWCPEGIVGPNVCSWGFQVPPGVPFQDLLTGNTMMFTQITNEIWTGDDYEKILAVWIKSNRPEGFFDVRCGWLSGFDEEKLVPERTKQCQNAILTGKPPIAFELGKCMERGTDVSEVPCCVPEKKGNGEEGLPPPNYDLN